MVMGRFRHIHFTLLVGISLFIPFLLAYSLYVSLSGIVLSSSEMSFEDPEDEDLATCQSEHEFKVSVSVVSFDPLLARTHSGGESSLLSSPLTFIAQNTPVLRC